jgi:radical SAM protein with 4Fe4S-binding SPASM domain
MIINEMINIEATNVCPAKCLICPRDEFKAERGIMTMELFRKIIDDCIQYNTKVVDLCGFGEAFSDNHLFERCEYVREKLPNAKIYISTNAWLLQARLWKDILKYIDILKFSIFSTTEEVYKEVHKLGFQRCLSNINDFLEYKGTQKPYTIGLFVETEENKHQRQEWVKYWEPKLDEIYVWLPHNWVDYRNYRTVDKTKQVSCGRPFRTMYVHMDGTVSVCCWDINKRLVIGDLNKQTIGEILNSTTLKEIREKHTSGDFSNLICERCDQTNPDDRNLIYSSNACRKVGKFAFEVE